MYCGIHMSLDKDKYGEKVSMFSHEISMRDIFYSIYLVVERSIAKTKCKAQH